MSPNRSIVNSPLPNLFTSTGTFSIPTATNTFVLITPTVFAPEMGPWPSLAPEIMDLMDAIDAYKDRLESIDWMGWANELDAYGERLASIREGLEASRTPLAPRTSYSSVFMNKKMAFIMFFVVLVVAYVVVHWWVRGAFLKAGEGTKKDERRERREGEEDDMEMIEMATKGFRKAVMEMERKEGGEENESEEEWEDEE